MKPKISLTSPQEAELSALRAKVARRREYMDLLELELANTRATLLEFTQLYNKRIGPLEAEQRRLQKLLDELTADQAPPSNGWSGRKKQAKQREDRSNGQRRNDPFFEKKPAVNNDPDYERKVRDLFRSLAKQYHPDMARSGEQKRRNEEIMAEINQAYSLKDLVALENLAKRDGQSVGAPNNAPAAELARLQTELQQLETMIFEVEQTIRELDLSHAMQLRSELKADQDDGRDAFGELEAEFKTRIAILQEQLLALGADLDLINLGTN